MSVSIGALPFLLLFGAISTLTNDSLPDVSANYFESTNNEFFKNQVQSALKNSDGVVSESLLKYVCKEYKTVFMDKELLMKTLEEHGFYDFSDDKVNDSLSCKMEGFTLEFLRQDATQPYMMKVSCSQSCGETELVNDINAEYALNVQEETYIKIKERLASKNLKIDEEEILDDDSILLTINID